MSTPTKYGKVVKEKRDYVDKVFDELYGKTKGKEKKLRSSIKKEIKEQIEVCEYLVRPITKEMIPGLLGSESLFSAERKIRELKFS